MQNINYSKNYIINIFKEKYGKTPYQYFLERKTETAKAYLAHSNLSVGEIAKNYNIPTNSIFPQILKNHRILTACVQKADEKKCIV